MWNHAGTLTALIIAITGLIGAITGFLVAWRAHTTINNQVNPAIKAVEDISAQNSSDIKIIQNGGPKDG
jgi:hypothetical protein